jgi:hypothetical protein
MDSTSEKTDSQSRYNHDIKIAPGFAKQFPAIEPLLLLSQEPFKISLGEKFDEHDRAARLHKRQFEILGVLSLVLALGALLGITGELLELALTHEHQQPTEAGQAKDHQRTSEKSPAQAPAHDSKAATGTQRALMFVFEVAALLSVGILLVSRFLLQARHRYRLECFLRERIRQWRFQLFLDGQFVERVVHSAGTPDAQAVALELSKRWTVFTEKLRDPEGALEKFTSDASAAKELLHEDTAYKDKSIAKEVFEILEIVRFDHQSQYPRRRLAREQGDRWLALWEHHEWAETIARGSLLIAVMIPVAQLAIAIGEGFGYPPVMGSAHTWLFAVAIALAIISAAARAYKTGMTVPDEMESYEQYLEQVEVLKAIFCMPGASLEQQRTALKELEISVAQELRRFLAMKGKATFLA